LTITQSGREQKALLRHNHAPNLGQVVQGLRDAEHPAMVDEHGVQLIN